MRPATKLALFSQAAFLSIGFLALLFVALELWVALTSPVQFRLPVPSPSGTEFAYYNLVGPEEKEGRPRYDLILATTEGRVLASFRMDPGTLLWSNAGHLAVHHRARSEVTILAHTDGRFVVLTRIGLRQGTEPRWSRDGNKLACLRPPTAGNEILVYDVQQPRAILIPLPPDLHLQDPVLLFWSPGSNSLFFRNREAQELVLNRLEIAEGKILTLARGLGGDKLGLAGLPRMSSDGTKIYLLPPQSAVVDAQTGNTLWALPADAVPLWSSWSGDGRMFFYVRRNDPATVFGHDFVTLSDPVVVSGADANGIFSLDGQSYTFRKFEGPPGPAPGVVWRRALAKSRGWRQVNLEKQVTQDLGRVELWPWEQDLSGSVLARVDQYTRIRYGLYTFAGPELSEFHFPTAREDLRQQLDAQDLILLVVAFFLAAVFASFFKRGASASVRAYYLLGLLLAAIFAHQAVLNSAPFLELPNPYQIFLTEMPGLGWWPTPSVAQILLENRFLVQNILWALIPPGLLHFAVVFPDRNRFLATRRWLWPFLYGVALLPLVGVIMTRDAPQPQQAILLRLLFVSGPVVLTALATALAYSYAHPPDRRGRDQIRWVAVAFGLMATGGFLLLLLHGFAPKLPLSGAPSLVETLRTVILTAMGYVAPVAIGYALVATKPYDIHLLVRRLLRYSLMAIPVVALFLAALAGLSWVATGSVAAPNGSIVVGAGLLAALLTVAGRGRLQKLVDRFYQPSQLEWREGLEQFAQGLPHLLDRPTLVARLETTLQRALGARQVYLFGLDRQAGRLRLIPPRGVLPTDAARVEFEPSEPLCAHLLKAPTFEVDVFPYNSALIPIFRSAADRLAKLEAAVVLGLKRREELMGLLVLGNKSSDEFYNAEELELLTKIAAQSALALENLELFEAVARDHEQRKELEDASELQMQLLPHSVPQLSGAQLAGQCLPARSISGDFYDFLELPEGKVGLVIGDVAGRGMHASLLMANIVDLMRAHAPTATDLGELVRKVNQHVYGPLRGSGLCSMFYGIYEVTPRRLQFVNAGHSPPLLLDARGPRFLESTGLPLGIFPEVTHESRCEVLDPEAILVLYSDGIIEARNASGEFYGLDRLVEVVSIHQSLEASRLLARILEDVSEFTAGAPIEDDQTLVLLRVGSD
jgi:serine phosphatase RsbU (regulator of sigma subunit)